MSTIVLFLGAFLVAQVGPIGQAPSDSRYSGAGTGNPFASNPPAQSTPPADNGSAVSNTAPATSAGALSGAPQPLGSAYIFGGNSAAAGPPPGTASSSLGQSYSPAGTQPNGLIPIGGNNALTPIGTATSPGVGALSPGRDALPRSNPAVSASSDSVLNPTGMMRAMMAPHANSRLSGEWVTLDDIVSPVSSRGDQSKQVEAYWDLCSSVADYFLGLREQEEIRRLRGLFPNSGAALQRAEQELAVRVGTAERAARASQWRLASLSGRGGDRLPLPANQPYCGTYETRYDQVFASRSSDEAAELNELISLRQAELADACEAVNRTDMLLREMSARPSSLSDATVLQALELIALERRAFVQIARDYNRRIARYVELARPGQIPSDQLIGMLIRRDPAATATRPGSSLPGDRRSQFDSDGQQTFARGADGWSPASAGDTATSSTAQRDDLVAPASAEAPPIQFTERSLLVPPR